MKKILFVFLCIFTIIFTASCGNIAGFQGEEGPKGEQGEVGPKGDKGETGASGKSAYELAVEAGFSGSVEEWLLSLVGEKGTTGANVVNIVKTNSVGLTDTYTITFSDGTTSQFTLTNANAISKIEKTDTEGDVDIYTITMSDGTKSEFSVTNGKDGAPGKTTEFRVEGKWLQWKYTDEDEASWRNLFETDGVPAPEGLVSVKFVTNGGSIGSNPETILVTAGTTINLPTPTYTGYSFDGWFENVEDEYAVSPDFRVHQSVTLYAKWTAGASVTGTKIYSLNDLKKIDLNRGGTYVLMNDINCQGLGLPSLCNTQATAFTGLFDGQGFKIYNFKITVGQYMGFIGYNSGTIRNLNLETGSLSLTAPAASGNVYAGILCGYNAGNISKCSVFDSEVSVKTHEREKHSGLICGYNTGSIKNCFAKGIVYTMEDWQSTKIGTGGAIAGGNSGSVENCFVHACVYASCKCGTSLGKYGEFAALVVGRNYSGGKISACVAMGTIESNQFLGDITAKNEGTVEKCYISESCTFNRPNDTLLLASKTTNANLNLKSFYTATLGWSASNWILDTIIVDNNKYPTLKQ